MDRNYRLKLFLYAFSGGIAGFIPLFILEYFFNIYSIILYVLVGVGAYLFYLKMQDEPEVKNQNISLIAGLYTSIIFSQLLIIIFILIPEVYDNGFIKNVIYMSKFNYDFGELFIENLLAVVFSVIGIYAYKFIFKFYTLNFKK